MEASRPGPWKEFGSCCILRLMSSVISELLNICKNNELYRNIDFFKPLDDKASPSQLLLTNTRGYSTDVEFSLLLYLLPTTGQRF